MYLSPNSMALKIFQNHKVEYYIRDNYCYNVMSTCKLPSRYTKYHAISV